MIHGQFSNYMHSNKKIGQRIYTITFTFKKIDFLNAVEDLLESKYFYGHNSYFSRQIN